MKIRLEPDGEFLRLCVGVEDITLTPKEIEKLREAFKTLTPARVRKVTENDSTFTYTDINGNSYWLES